MFIFYLNFLHFSFRWASNKSQRKWKWKTINMHIMKYGTKYTHTCARVRVLGNFDWAELLCLHKHINFYAFFWSTPRQLAINGIHLTTTSNFKILNEHCCCSCHHTLPPSTFFVFYLIMCGSFYIFLHFLRLKFFLTFLIFNKFINLTKTSFCCNNNHNNAEERCCFQGLPTANDRQFCCPSVAWRRK